MQVTITLLPVALSLVHIPRSRLPSLTHPILRQLLQPNPTFLNITCNEIELSIFAEHCDNDFRHLTQSGTGEDQVEISDQKWNVLQIDTHSDQIGSDNSGARVNELSAPLAAAGISILYQSSYMCDFIFVKESRLQEAMSLFALAGFDLYSPAPESSIPGSTLSLASPSSPSLSPTCTMDVGGSTILTRARSGTNTSLSSSASTSSTKPHSRAPSPHDQPSSSTPGSPRLGGPHPKTKSKSHSPTSSEVRILPPDLTCVGLSDEHADTWCLKIVKLMAFPDLIPYNKNKPGTTSHSHSQTPKIRSPSLPLPISISTPTPTPPLSRSSSSSSGSGSGSGSEWDTHTPSTSTSTTSLHALNVDDTCIPKPLERTITITSLDTTIPPPPPAPTHQHHDPPHPHSPLASTHTTAPTHTSPTPPTPHTHPPVPFYSLTRTPEGSSLTTDASLLAVLFPESVRFMVICGGGLPGDGDERAVADEDVDEGVEEEGEEGGDGDGKEKDDGDDEEEAVAEDEGEEDEAETEGDDDEESDTTLKCLQIDLRRFGLDKHGLVNRFSRVLEENGINHMYSSTFKTANLLVDKRHVMRAQALLRAC